MTCYGFLRQYIIAFHSMHSYFISYRV
uniref:Uncharacterized protein n=1 Tax=Arundo donax TaxID=35708 RepID=A0A0A8YCF4_ARUDO